MGSPVYGQLGNPQADGKLPTRVDGKLAKSFMEKIACGAYYVAVLTSRSEVAPGSNNKKREQNERTYASSASTPTPTSSTLTPLTVECRDL